MYMCVRAHTEFKKITEYALISNFGDITKTNPLQAERETYSSRVENRGTHNLLLYKSYLNPNQLLHPNHSCSSVRKRNILLMLESMA